MLTTLGDARKRTGTVLTTLGDARKRTGTVLTTLGDARGRIGTMLTTLMGRSNQPGIDGDAPVDAVVAYYV